MDDITVKIIIAILSSSVALLLGIIKMYNDRLREIKLKLSDKKYHTYSEIVGTLFEMINRQKGLSKIKDEQILKKIMDVKRDLFLYGNDAIIKKFFEWEDNRLSGKRFWNWVELAVLVRKDMGNRWTRITADDILKSLLNENDDYDSFKNELLNM